MKRQNRDITLLRHLQQTFAEIHEISQDDESRFLDDRAVNLAVMRLLHMMSESASLLSEAIKSDHPQIEWAKLKGFRNFLVHDYLGDIDYGLVWRHIT